MNKTYCANSPLCDEDSCGCDKWEEQNPQLIKTVSNFGTPVFKLVELLKSHPNHRVVYTNPKAVDYVDINGHKVK